MANSKQIGPSSTGASAGDKNSIVDLQTLYEVYWAPHGALIDAGAATLMCSYAEVSKVPREFRGVFLRPGRSTVFQLASIRRSTSTYENSTTSLAL